MILRSCYLLILLLMSSSAHAYIDPGSGGAILQGALAVLTGALFTMKVYWFNIVGFFRRVFSSQRGVETEQGDENNTEEKSEP